MTCPICDQQPMNCDCTPRERAMWRELHGDPAPAPSLTDAEREAVEYFSQWCIGPSNRLERYAATLRGLLGRLGGER